MQKLWSQLRGQRLYVEEGGDLVGIIAEAVMERERPVIAGYAVFTRDWHERFLSAQDLLTKENKLFIRNPDLLLQKRDIVRIDEGIILFGLRVENREGKFLGKIYDWLVDGETGHLVKLYCRKKRFLWVYDTRIFTPGQVVEWSHERLIVSDDGALRIPVGETCRVGV